MKKQHKDNSIRLKPQAIQIQNKADSKCVSRVQCKNSRGRVLQDACLLQYENIKKKIPQGTSHFQCKISGERFPQERCFI